MIDWILSAFDTFTAKTIIPVILTVLLQLLLCFKANRIWVKFLPAAVLAAAILFFNICFSRIDNIITVVFLYFAFQAFHLLLASGIGWGIWAIVRIIRKKVPGGTTEQIS